MCFPDNAYLDIDTSYNPTVSLALILLNIWYYLFKEQFNMMGLLVVHEFINISTYSPSWLLFGVSLSHFFISQGDFSGSMIRVVFYCVYFFTLEKTKFAYEDLKPWTVHPLTYKTKEVKSLKVRSILSLVIPLGYKPYKVYDTSAVFGHLGTELKDSETYRRWCTNENIFTVA